jgi:hypothetical protein
MPLIMFAGAAPDQLWGEATPIYMFLPVVADRIRDYNAAIKLIFILRDPVARAFSHYKMQRARQREHLPFAFAAAVEVFRVRLFSRDPDRNKDPIRIHSCLSCGFSARQIERFLCRFPGTCCS